MKPSSRAAYGRRAFAFREVSSWSCAPAPPRRGDPRPSLGQSGVLPTDSGPLRHPASARSRITSARRRTDLARLRREHFVASRGAWRAAAQARHDRGRRGELRALFDGRCGCASRGMSSRPRRSSRQREKVILDQAEAGCR